MLGITRYKGYSLDLWVGKKEDFFCDLMLELDLTSFESQIKENNPRHIALVVHEDSAHENLFVFLKKLIQDQKLPSETKRITFLAQNIPHHHKIQDDLCHCFKA